MENSKADGNGTKITDPTTPDENPNNSGVVGEQELNMVRRSSTMRTPFTNLSQVDADLSLARTLQEQERAYMMLRMSDGSEYGSWEGGSYIHQDVEDFDDPSGDEYYQTTDDDDGEDEDTFEVHAHAESGEDSNMSLGVELDPASFPNDEAYARALQDAEDREIAARLLAFAGITEHEGEDEEEDLVGNSQNTWEQGDPDELLYEELIALGEVVGTESRGLSAEAIASLPLLSYKMQSTQDESNDSCVICWLDYEDGDALTLLSCKHSYHSDCINNWLRINKVCPVCSTEVSTSLNS